MEYDTRDKITPLGTIDPEIDEFLKAHPLPKWGAAPDEFGKVAERKEQVDTDVEYSIHITMRDGYQSETRVHKADASGSKTPLIVIIYGGGFIMGDCTQLSQYARMGAKLFNATVVNLSYRLAPAHPFPAAPNDVWDSLTWLAKNAHTLGADPSLGFVVGGPSAGANLAAVATQKYLNEGLSPPITGLWLSIPYVLEEEIVPAEYKDVWFSREQNAKAPVIDKEALDGINAAYRQDFKSPDFSPFNAKNPHKGMPPTVVQVVGMDPLRDDGLIYERVLRANGVKTKLEVYPGAPHGHIMFPGQLAAKAHFDTFAGIAWLLGKHTPTKEEFMEAMAANPFISV